MGCTRHKIIYSFPLKLRDRNKANRIGSPLLYYLKAQMADSGSQSGTPRLLRPSSLIIVWL